MILGAQILTNTNLCRIRKHMTEDIHWYSTVVPIGKDTNLCSMHRLNSKRGQNFRNQVYLYITVANGRTSLA